MNLILKDAKVTKALSAEHTQAVIGLAKKVMDRYEVVQFHGDMAFKNKTVTPVMREAMQEAVKPFMAEVLTGGVSYEAAEYLLKTAGDANILLSDRNNFDKEFDTVRAMLAQYK